jgi:predicted transposase YbfD/YdcC
MATASLEIKTHFRRLRDPRRKHRQQHRFLDIVVIALCAVIAGAESWPQIEAFGRRRHAWLKRFLALTNGIPSHDTFQRLFAALEPQAFQACVRQWLVALSGALGVEQIAIDGKTLRGSANAASELGPLQLVSAWATQSHVSLGQVAVAADSNEITAIPRLLELLELKGALVSIDAMGCQKEIAERIIAGGGNYVLTVKGNQEQLLQGVQECLQEALDEEHPQLSFYETEERSHGRVERRCYTVLPEVTGLGQRQQWRGLRAIGMCYSERTVQGETSTEVRYFIGSKKASARYYGRALRSHWGIENNLHWQLDVSFGEDRDRTQERNAAENMALLRRVALTLLKRHPSKDSLVSKRKQAGWACAFLEEILRGSANPEKP